MSELFDADDHGHQQTQETQIEGNPYETLVGEGKKFKTPEDLAKAKLESDSFINKLKGELQEMRTELQSRLTLEEMMDKIRSQEPPAGEMQNTTQQEPGPSESTNDLEQRVRKLLEEERSKESRERNIKTVRDTLKQRFGADYNNRLKSLAQSLEVSESFLTDMAGKSPQAFIALVEGSSKTDTSPSGAPPRSSMDVNHSMNEASRKNWAYYSNLRKQDPRSYFSAKVQAEIHKEAMRQGPKFYE